MSLGRTKSAVRASKGQPSRDLTAQTLWTFLLDLFWSSGWVAIARRRLFKMRGMSMSFFEPVKLQWAIFRREKWANHPSATPGRLNITFYCVKAGKKATHGSKLAGGGSSCCWFFLERWVSPAFLVDAALGRDCLAVSMRVRMAFSGA